MMPALNRTLSQRTTHFYFQPDLPGKGDSFIVLAGSRWNDFLRRYIGVIVEPFFERPCQPHEPDSFENGQPYAWRYTKVELLLKDEKRWLNEQQFAHLTKLANRAQQDAIAMRSTSQPADAPHPPSLPGTEPGLSQT